MAAITPQDESSAAGRHLYQLWMKYGLAAVCYRRLIVHYINMTVIVYMIREIRYLLAVRITCIHYNRQCLMLLEPGTGHHSDTHYSDKHHSDTYLCH